MEIAKACYSVSKLRAAADMVKAINWSVKRKKRTLRKIYRDCESLPVCKR